MFRGVFSQKGMDVKRPKRRHKKRELQLPSVFLNNSWSSNDDSEEPEGADYKRLLPVQSTPGKSKMSPRQRHEKKNFWSNVKSGKTRFLKGNHKYRNTSETGIYNKSVDNFYKLLTRENSIMLPPLQTSGRVKFNISNYIDMAEKKYVMRDFKTEGKISKFARDEVYFPSLNKDIFTCYECRRRYVSDMYTEAFATRNSKNPRCVAIATRTDNKFSTGSRGTRAQFCDVLGKRFCSECGDNENRKMRQAILNTYSTGERSESESVLSSHMTSKGSFNRKQVVIDPIPTLVTYEDS